MRSFDAYPLVIAPRCVFPSPAGHICNNLLQNDTALANTPRIPPQGFSYIRTSYSTKDRRLQYNNKS